MHTLRMLHAMIMINLVQSGTGTIWAWRKVSTRFLPGMAAFSYDVSQIWRHCPLFETLRRHKLQCINPMTPHTPLSIIPAPTSVSTSDADSIPADNNAGFLLSRPQRYLLPYISPLSPCCCHTSPLFPTLKYLPGQTTWSTPPPSPPMKGDVRR